jgi:hypothetical protein
MALDHYVSQVHLRNFYSPVLGNKMHAIRKRDLLKFPCGSKDVCRIEDGSTNAYLSEERIIEEFLKGIEPRYNEAVSGLRRGEIDETKIYVIAGFAAYVATCSPAAMRIHSAPMRQVLEATSKILDAKGMLDPSPAGLGSRSFTELLESKAIQVNVDQKYPQAIGISNILKTASVFGNGLWDIIVNDHASRSPFFTSDFPIAVEHGENPRVLNRIVPLTPELALRIIPQPETRGEVDLSFSKMRFRVVRPNHSEVRSLNQTIIRSAEELVFFRDDLPWIPDFVRKHARFRVQAHTEEIRTGDSYFVISSMQLREA